MTMLNADSIKAVETKLNDYKRNPKLTPQGFPVALVTDLLDTIRMTHTLKKRYQHLADRRAETIAKIFSLTSRSISDQDELPSGH